MNVTKKKYFHHVNEIISKKKLKIAVLVIFSSILITSLLPVPEFFEPYSMVTLDSEGILLSASIAEDEQWRFPPVENVPEKFMHGITYFEDKRFLHHPGVDLLAMLRALRQNIKAGRIESGGSTLTMQVVRLSRKGKPRTITEKIIEMILAVRMELSLSKQEILSLYASHAPYGGNVVGIEAASWRYFGRAPSRLSWAETAMLAVLPNSPSLIHPGKNRDKLVKKRDRLLDRMLEREIISPLTCSLSKAESLPPEPYPIRNLAYHLHSRIITEQSYNNTELGDKGRRNSRIRTTLNKNLQVRSAEIVQQHSNKLSGNKIHNAAAIIIEVGSGNILAYIGNSGDITKNEKGNHVDIINAPRSTGSILKPLLYAGMMHAGDLLPSQLVPDIPTSFGGFAPKNFNNAFTGAVPASEVLSRSLNVPAVRMLNYYGIE